MRSTYPGAIRKRDAFRDVPVSVFIQSRYDSAATRERPSHDETPYLRCGLGVGLAFTRYLTAILIRGRPLRARGSKANRHFRTETRLKLYQTLQPYVTYRATSTSSPVQIGVYTSLEVPHVA